MTDGSGAPQTPPPGFGYPPPPAYGYGYGYHPGYPPPGYGYPAQAGHPPLGRIRPSGVSVLLYVVTLGIYGCVYNYTVHEDMKRHTGRGIGGGIALLLTIFAGIAMPFVTPNEVGNLYALQGKPKPVSAKTGIWAVAPLLVGAAIFVAVYIVIFTTASYHDSTDSYGDPTRSPDLHGGQIVGLIVAPLLMVAIGWTGQIIAFVKTNRALNNYWSSLGVRP